MTKQFFLSQGFVPPHQAQTAKGGSGTETRLQLPLEQSPQAKS
jgi:hypothetical protein